MAGKEALFSLGHREQIWLNTGIIFSAGSKPIKHESKFIKRGQESLADKKEREINYAAQKRNLGLIDDNIKGKSVFDFGCGSGNFVIGLLEKGLTQEAWGVDKGEEIKETQGKFPKYKRNFFAADFSESGVSTTFLSRRGIDGVDLAVAHGSIHAWTDPEEKKLMENKLNNILGIIKHDGEIRIWPVYPKKRWEKMFEEYNSGSSSNKAVIEFKQIEEAKDPLDLTNMYLVVKKNGVCKHQC